MGKHHKIWRQVLFVFVFFLIIMSCDKSPTSVQENEQLSKKHIIVFLWKYQFTKGACNASLTRDGKYVIVSYGIEGDAKAKSSNSFLLFDNVGKLLWEKKVLGKGWAFSIDGEHILSYVMENVRDPFWDHMYYLYDMEGHLLWKKKDKRTFDFAENGKFIIAYYNAWDLEEGPTIISIYNLDGSLYWECDLKRQTQSACISNDGNYLVIGFYRKLFFYSKKDGIAWNHGFEDDVFRIGGVDISENNKFVLCRVVGDYFDDICLFDSQGKVNWEGRYLKKRLPKGVKQAKFIRDNIIEIDTGFRREWGKKYHVDLKGNFWKPIQEDTVAREYLKKTGVEPYDIVISKDRGSGVVVSADKKTITYFKIHE